MANEDIGVFRCHDIPCMPFLRRTHAVHRGQRPSTLARTKPHHDTKHYPKVFIHTLPRTDPSTVHSYRRLRDGVLPCPFCRRQTFTEEGLWVHLCTTVADRFRPIALHEEDGTLHVAIEERTVPASLKVQQSISHMTGDSEVVFWRKGGWRSKLYKPGILGGGELVPVAPGPIVEWPTPKMRKGSRKPPPEPEMVDYFPELLPGYKSHGYFGPVPEPCQKRGSVKSMNKRKRVPRRAKQEDPKTKHLTQPLPEQLYKYDDFVPLSEAIRRLAMRRDMLPMRRTYVHPTSHQPWTMGEWLLCKDRDAPHRRPLDYSWVQLLNDRETHGVSDAERVFMKHWNAAIENAERTSDRDIPLICRGLLQRVGLTTPEEVWMPHIMNLWESKQLRRDDMLILMREYHEIRTLSAQDDEPTTEKGLSGS